MTWRRILYSVIIAFFVASCSTINKAMHPSLYCIEKGCHKKKIPDSDYCQAHYTLKMMEIVRTAEQVKRASEEAEKRNAQEK